MIRNKTIIKSLIIRVHQTKMIHIHYLALEIIIITINTMKHNILIRENNNTDRVIQTQIKLNNV